jgi:hypothetical protein
MQHAKKMILVDERVYDELWKRPIVDTTKSYLNNQLQADLLSDDMTDDLKAKHYRQTLNRFLNQKHQLPIPEKLEHMQRGKRTQQATPMKRATPLIKTTKQKQSPSPIQLPRRSKRETKQPLRWTGLDE